MPGILPYSWREGNRGEYLAQYFLSALGVSVPVPRQEDIGADFYNALARREGQKLTFHSPFMVQVGSADGKDFTYGGVRNGAWHKASLDWLFSQELPLFVGTIDQKAARFRLYSTSAMWAVRYQFGDITEAELCPEQWHDPLNESRSAIPVTDLANCGDGYKFRIPLFNPIVDLTVSDLHEKRDAAIDALSVAIEAEQNNITNRRLNVHVVTWFPGNATNDAAGLRRHRGGVTFWSNAPGKNIDEQVDTLKGIACVLALNFAAQRNEGGIKNLAPVFRLFNPGSIPSWIREKLPTEVRNTAKWLQE